MKTKQIIDEVDVSWCEWIREIELDSEYICTCNSLNKTSSYCKDNPNCYYKQLKRVENQIVDLNKMVDTKEQECDQLKVENDELEKWKENVANLFDKTCRCKYLNEENAHCSFYNKECIAINQCLYKNQQTIIEIKEIALGVRNYLDCPSPRDVRYEMDIILQKISECEVENGHTKED